MSLRIIILIITLRSNNGTVCTELMVVVIEAVDTNGLGTVSRTQNDGKVLIDFLYLNSKVYMCTPSI